VMPQVTCPVCGLECSKSNWSKHLKRYHPETIKMKSHKLKCRQTNSKETDPDHSTSRDEAVTSSATSLPTASMSVQAISLKANPSTEGSTLEKSVKHRHPVSSTTLRKTSSKTTTVTATTAANHNSEVVPPVELTQTGLSSFHAIDLTDTVIVSMPELTSQPSSVGYETMELLVTVSPEPPTGNTTREQALVVENLHTSTEFLHGSLEPATAVIVSVAAQDIVEQHENYDAISLASMIRQKYPGIPENVVPYLVIASTAAARHVANVHLMRESYRSAEDPVKRRKADTAIGPMLSWSLGLRRVDRQRPPPLRSDTKSSDVGMIPESNSNDKAHNVYVTETLLTLSPRSSNKAAETFTDSHAETVTMILDTPSSKRLGNPTASVSVSAGASDISSVCLNLPSMPALENLSLPIEMSDSVESFNEMAAEIGVTTESWVHVNLAEQRLAQSKLRELIGKTIVSTKKVNCELPVDENIDHNKDQQQRERLERKDKERQENNELEKQRQDKEQREREKLEKKTKSDKKQKD